MKRIRIEGDSPDLIAGFVAGVEWVNDSAITVVDLDYSGRTRVRRPGGPGRVRRGRGPAPDGQRHRGEGVRSWRSTSRRARYANIASGRWLDLLGALAPALENALDRVGRHVPCPVHGGTDGFRLFRDADQTGGGVCNTCGTFPDGFALLMWVNRWSFPEALRSVAHALGLAAERVPEPRAVPNPRPRPPERDRESVIEALNRVWQQSLDPTDRRAAPLRAYLSRRGLSGARLDGEVVRFHPALGYWQRNGRDEAELIGRFPAMVALVTGADGMPVTVHRTYLTADGRKARS